jgi:aminoglycoside phosphotransferase (APT) family kinase protein
MSSLLDEPRPVRPGEELDLVHLETFLKDAIPGLASALEVHQFPSGFSNLTYLVRAGERDLVLRRPPVGSKVKAAHDMHREYRVLSALHPVYPKTPAPLAYCDDATVLGAPFYVMERIEGVILRGKKPAEFSCPPALARKCCDVFVENLARLHQVNYEAIGLDDLRREGSFTRRQVDGWIDRYRGSQTDDIPSIEQLADYLRDNCPEDVGAVFIHNDYKFDNIVLDPSDLSRIIGVLDWEMSTIGDPLMDLGVALSYWNEKKDLSLGMIPCFLTLEPGSMTRQEVAEAYALKTGRDIGNILFYYVFGLLKLAVIVQQIYYRYKQGLTKDERFAPLIFVVGALGMTGMTALDSGKI